MTKFSPHNREAGFSPVTAPQTAGAVSSPTAPATFSLTKLLEDASRFEREHSEIGECEYLLNIIDNLMRARPGDFVMEILQDAKAHAERTIENLEEDARWLGAHRVEL